MKDTLRLQKKGFPVGVIEMIGLLAVDAVLIFCIIILAMKLWDCSANLDRAEYRIDSRRISEKPRERIGLHDCYLRHIFRNA